MSVLIANAANVCNFLSPTINKVCYVMLCYVMSTLIHQMELIYVSGGGGGGWGLIWFFFMIKLFLTLSLFIQFFRHQKERIFLAVEHKTIYFTICLILFCAHLFKFLRCHHI